MADDGSSILAALRGVAAPWANVPLQEAIPGGAGTTPEGSPTALSNSLAGTMNIPKHLIEAAKNAPPPGLRREDYTDVPGSAQPGDNLVGAATEAAMKLAGNGAPAAETNAVGIFGGRFAQTADLQALKEAQQMRMGGKLPGDVRADTGWFRSPADQQWRFEIPDNNMRLKFKPENHEEGSSIIGNAGDLVSHGALYQAYPELAGLPVESTKNSFLFDAGSKVPRATGAYYPKDQTPAHISVEGPNSPEITSTMAHELQHGVQDIEGFASGANPSTYSNLIMQGWRKNPNVLEGNPLANVLNEAYPLYRKTAGEVESRNVQNRLLWTPQQRGVIHPWSSQDVPYRDQVVYDPIASTIKALKNQ